MKTEDKAEFATILNGMAENFNAKLTKEGLRVRFQALSDCSIEQLRAACTKLVRNRIYPGMPTTGEIRAAMVEEKLSLEDTAQLRVNEIMGQIRAVGSYGSPTWSDPIVADIMQRRYSWGQLCAMTEADLKWWGKEFCEVYRSLAQSEQYLQIEHANQNPKLIELVKMVGRTK
jgi:hypothetical protein